MNTAFTVLIRRGSHHLGIRIEVYEFSHVERGARFPPPPVRLLQQPVDVSDLPLGKEVPHLQGVVANDMRHVAIASLGESFHREAAQGSNRAVLRINYKNSPRTLETVCNDGNHAEVSICLQPEALYPRLSVFRRSIGLSHHPLGVPRTRGALPSGLDSMP